MPILRQTLPIFLLQIGKNIHMATYLKYDDILIMFFSALIKENVS